MAGISLCMIVKNEEAILPNCLNSIKGYVDEIIIVDTGSSDRTKEIALSYTNQVYDYIWVNDFSAARNFSISKANYEFILILDADEIVESFDPIEAKRLLERYPSKIGRLIRVNVFTRNANLYRYTERVNRLFSKEYYRYEGIIHEQVMRISEDLIKDMQSSDNTYPIPLTVKHSGYEGELSVRKKKTERNIALLKDAIQINSHDPYLLYQLGKSYYMEENYKCACEIFGQALYFDLDPRLEYVQDMVESYGYSLINSGQYKEALQLEGVYEEFSHTADFIFLMALIYMNNGKFEKAIEEFQKASQKEDCKMEGVNSYLAYYNIAVIYECLNDIKLAGQYYRRCNNYEPALLRLKQFTESK